jgi:hypothetical protein
MALLSVSVVATAARADPTIAAAGDIACDPDSQYFNGGLGEANHCRQAYTGDLLESGNYAQVLALGDLQYNNGTLAKFQISYDPSWGTSKAITRPAVGNHEYEDPSAAGYFDYFNGVGSPTGPAGDRSLGYYSFDIPLPSGATWHLISLNSQCADPDAATAGQLGACDPGSPQEQWLKNDLATHPADCTLAYWHHPLFSSSTFANSPQMATFWQDLQDAGADLVLNGHHHDYERFARQNADGIADPTAMREFVVGTGGHSHFAMGTIQPNSEARDDTTFGILELTLHDAGYEWRFVPEAGETYTDFGSAACSLKPTSPGSGSAALASAAPSNQFTLGKVKRNRRRGTARLTVLLPGPGEVDLFGNKVRKVERGTEAAGELRVPIRLKARAERKLNPDVKTKVKVSFTPAGGQTNTKAKLITLIKRD